MQEIHDRHARDGTLESWPLAAQQLIASDKAEARDLWRQGYRPPPNTRATPAEFKHDDLYISCSWYKGAGSRKLLPHLRAEPCTFWQRGITSVS